MVHPAKYFRIPFNTVLGLLYPMTLIGKDHQTRGYMAKLQRCESGDCLGVRVPEIPFTRDDELRCAPPGDLVGGIPFFIVARRLVIEAAPVIPLVRPELICLVGHRSHVENTVILDQTPE